MPQHIVLIPIDSELGRAMEAGPAAFLLRYRARLGEVADRAREVVRQTMAMRASPRWGGYLVIDERSHAVVGTCGFKGDPVDGAVEITYHTFPPHEGKGYATAMAVRLLEIAWSSPGVVRVLAHTLPERGASAHVLERLGLRRVEEAMDANDGAVWRWERRRPGRSLDPPAAPQPT